MIFQSIDFVIFFLAVFAIYWLLNRRLQNILLLTASYVFYGYVHHWLVILIFGYTVANYFAGVAIERFPERRKLYLILSIASSLAVLGVFKYFNFFVDNVNALFIASGFPTFTNTLSIFLPIGISFYTFQTLSYTIDVYKHRAVRRAGGCTCRGSTARAGRS